MIKCKKKCYPNYFTCVSMKMKLLSDEEVWAVYEPVSL